MLKLELRRGLLALGCACMMFLPGLPARSMGAVGAGRDSPPPIRLADSVWTAARTAGKDEASFLAPLHNADVEKSGAMLALLKGAISDLEANFAKREAARTEQMTKVEKELAETLAAEQTPSTLSKALRQAVEIHELCADKPAFVQQERIQALIKRADSAARTAESTGDWLIANELYVRLNLLLEEEATYKPDARRQADRLGMIQLYVPRRLWEMRNTRRLAEGLKELPPFNALGEDFNAKVSGISQGVVMAAMLRATESHIERRPLRELLVSGFDSVKTMVTTKDLAAAFPGIDDLAARDRLIAWIDSANAQLRLKAQDIDQLDLNNRVSALLDQSRLTVKIPVGAILHELGNGAFDRLDEFSQIIWPDELPRFRRIVDGDFIGVGVQIQLDEESQFIRIVSPLEGTPAFRAGVRSGDLIKKIDDQSALGMTLNQAVELITGRAGTNVKLTMERQGQDVDFDLTRARIPIRTVKGWRREGLKEDQWDWYIDPAARIGYIRLTGFQESTTRELHAAINEMKSNGLRGIILDLRFNPGGLLTQAVSVANTFIDNGLLVYTETPEGRRGEEHRARPKDQLIGKNTPLVVLINEGSASASEIVSGAIRYYADKGVVNALVVGKRSYGKGSVQNVLQLSSAAMLKITTQYYFLPDGRLIHRRDHAKQWGVDPHLIVDMLPKQISDALTIRQDADTPNQFLPPLPPIPATNSKPLPHTVEGQGGGGLTAGAAKPTPDPNKLLEDGVDLQLQAALLLLQTQAAARQQAKAG